VISVSVRVIQRCDPGQGDVVGEPCSEVCVADEAQLDVEPLGDEPFTVIAEEGCRHVGLIGEGRPAVLEVETRHRISIQPHNTNSPDPQSSQPQSRR